MPNDRVFDEIFQPERLSDIAVLFESRAISYEDLRALTIRTAEVFHALHIARGDRVGILLSDSPEFVASFVAIISLGAVAVPINLALRKEEQLLILKDCGARAVIVEAPVALTLFRESESQSQQLSSLKDLLVVVRDGESVPARIGGINTQIFDQAGHHRLDSDFPAPAAGDTDAFILYTSGSTGEPKGAVHRQSDIFYTNETYCREVLRLRSDDRMFSSSRLPFAYGLGNALTFPLLNGFTTILCREKPSAEVIARVFQDHRPTIFFGVPVVYRMLLDHHRNVNQLDRRSSSACRSSIECCSITIAM